MDMPEQQKIDHFPQGDVLSEIPLNDWSTLRDLYKSNWPNYIYTYYYLDNCIKWKSKEPEFTVKIYSFNNNWADGTFIAESILGGQPHINMDTLEGNCQRLEEALLHSRVIDWSKGHLFCGIHEKQRRLVNSLSKCRSVPIKYDLLSGYHWISKENCINIDLKCPAEVYVARLREDQVPLLNSIWPHSYPGSEEFLLQIVRLNYGMGVFLKSDDSICSWIMKNQFSGLGILQTLEQYQGRGYAKLVTRALMKEMAIEDMDIHACVLRANYKSQNLFKGLGFKHIDDIFWLQFKKTT